MRSILTLVSALLLFALVWAAGHDILAGEQDVWMEHTVVILGLGLAALSLLHRWREHGAR